MLLLTLRLVQRGHINAVTDLAVLVPCDLKDKDGLATFLPELAGTQAVRVVTFDDLTSNPRRIKEALSSMWDYERAQFEAVLALLSALQKRDKLAVSRARGFVTQALALKREGDRKLGISPAPEADLEFGRVLIHVFGLKPGQEKEAIQRWNGYRHGPKAEANYRWLLSQLMSEALDSVRLVLWWSGKQLRPALYCPQAKAALYAILLMKVAAGRGWGVCPYCGQFFAQKRSDQNYCTIAHREAHRVARWRATKKSRPKKKGGLDGTRQTR
jgi:hypothetical protein